MITLIFKQKGDIKCISIGNLIFSDCTVYDFEYSEPDSADGSSMLPLDVIIVGAANAIACFFEIYRGMASDGHRPVSIRLPTTMTLVDFIHT